MTIRPIAAVLALPVFALSIAVSRASTNPDSPTPLHANVIIGTMSHEGSYNQYFSFRAGPGTVRLRLTIRPNDGGETLNAEILDDSGSSLAKVGDGTSNGRDLVRTTAINLTGAQTLVLYLQGNAEFYGARHPSYRVQLDGDVKLDKSARPLVVH